MKLTDKPLLTPQWGKGDARSNDYLQVVEIPLQTNSVSFVFRNLHRSGQAGINENCIAHPLMSGHGQIMFLGLYMITNRSVNLEE